LDISASGSGILALPPHLVLHLQPMKKGKNFSSADQQEPWLGEKPVQEKPANIITKQNMKNQVWLRTRQVRSMSASI
jgi:hypothetical protein